MCCDVRCHDTIEWLGWRLKERDRGRGRKSGNDCRYLVLSGPVLSGPVPTDDEEVDQQSVHTTNHQHEQHTII